MQKSFNPKIFYFKTISALVSSILVFYFAYKVVFDTPNFNCLQPTRIYINDKHSLKKQVYPFLKNKLTFSIAHRILTFNSKLKNGSYIIDSNKTNRQIINDISRGIQKPVKLILNNIKNKEELIEKIVFQTNIKKNELTKLLFDPKFVKSLGFTTENIMALFIPNTYEIYWNIRPKKLIFRMYNEYQKFWNSNRIEMANKIKLTPIQVSVLASIVQSETLCYEEARLIAGVYRNRLRKKLRLMACPTLKHSSKNNIKQRVLHKDSKKDCSYNTYRKFGLPPGPICLPSPIYIDAVLTMKKSDFLFFCAKEDFSGKHNFSKTFSQHLSYARKYWKALNKRKIFR